MVTCWSELVSEGVRAELPPSTACWSANSISSRVIRANDISDRVKANTARPNFVIGVLLINDDLIDKLEL
jgi:hypothetical protein